MPDDDTEPGKSATHSFDDADLTFMRSLMPEGAIPIGLFAVVQWINPDTGAQQWRRYSPFDAPVSQAAGIALIGIMDMLASTPLVERSNVFLPPDD